MKQIRPIIIGLLAITSVVNAQNKSAISLEQFSASLKQAGSNAQILDARSNEEFLQNHIKGAVNADQKSANYQQLLDGLDKSKPTFVYSIANGRSSVLAKQLRDNGYKAVYELPGGLANWVGSGYPIISNTKKGLSLSPAQYQELTGSADLVLIDFGSKYCGACKRLVPVLDSLKNKTGFAAKVISIEQYDNTALAKQLKINVLPTLVLYHNKKKVWKKSGFSTTTQIEQVVNSNKTKLASAN
ncbi:sulfurtransferase [Mucilaginibacter sp. PPCGB 2223]|uniref:thioredoxin domain-containing protein n=1 Tax=Mucilaginibacter sp. PPCGB 2223 TaxID=1886027 RepID=UPI00082492D6|nr:thioredoxin domain-containing protein [Mucilaginibacter sp. PPCGB 2223]OCX52037.1 sulfurtransferase [Mucilaginibacter sp. PPCGB 2223]